MVKMLWLKRKLKKIRKKQKAKSLMEKSKDVKINVTGVSMSAESNLNEHDRTPKNDKEKSEGEENGNSRKDD